MYVTKSSQLEIFKFIGVTNDIHSTSFTGSIIVSKNLNETTEHVTLELFVDVTFGQLHV